MKKEELIKFCKYYKGEDQCPYDYPDIKHSFWSIERNFVRISQNDYRFESEKNAVLRYIELHSDANNDLLNNEIPIEKRAVLYFVNSMLCKWMPTKAHMINQY